VTKLLAQPFPHTNILLQSTDATYGTRQHTSGGAMDHHTCAKQQRDIATTLRLRAKDVRGLADLRRAQGWWTADLEEHAEKKIAGLLQEAEQHEKSAEWHLFLAATGAGRVEFA
jgi:high-affinity Fe2+/Pb2+ permease